MASVPNMRPGAAPLVPGLAAPAVVAGAEFASLISAVPDALLQPVSTEAIAEPAEGDAEVEAASIETPGVDATQLAALLPVAPIAVATTPSPPPSAAGDAAEPPKVETRLAKTPAAPVAKAPVPVSEVPPAPVPIADKPEEAKPVAPSPTTGEAPEPNVAVAPIDPEAGDAPGNAPVAVEKTVEAAKQVIERLLRSVAPPAIHASNATVRPQNGQVARDIEPVTDVAGPQPDAAPVAFTPATTPPAPAPLTNGPAPQAAEAPDRAIERALDLAQDGEWLDRLARDIARTADGDAPMRFRLHPQTLGHMRVELAQGDHGTSVRLTVETEAARAILADAQPRLAAEARAQGVRIAETHVDLSGSDRHAAGDQRRQDETRQTPIIRTAREAAPGGAAPVQPARSRSDRYA